MNDVLNGIPINNLYHNGSHRNYNNLVLNYLNSIPSTANADQAYNAVIIIINRVKNSIQNNPTTHVNNISF